MTLTTEGTTVQWYSGASVVGDANSRLMQGFISADATPVGTPVTFTFNTVPSGAYSVLAYIVGFDFQADYRQSYQVISVGALMRLVSTSKPRQRLAPRGQRFPARRTQ